MKIEQQLVNNIIQFFEQLPMDQRVLVKEQSLQVLGDLAVLQKYPQEFIYNRKQQIACLAMCMFQIIRKV